MNRVVRALLNSRAVKFVVDIRTFATRKTSCVVFRGAYLRDRYKLGMDRFFAEHDPAARTRLRIRLAHHMFDAIKRGDWHADAATRAEIETLAGAPSSVRSEEHTSELQSLMRISYAVFCLKKKNKKYTYNS